MASGDYLKVPYTLYEHVGIDIGDGTVVHLSKSTGEICRVPLKDFRDGRELKICYSVRSDSAQDVVARALSRVGETDYSLVFNNCEHFATWCKTGRAESRQVRAAQRRLISVVSSFTIGLTLGGPIGGAIGFALYFSGEKVVSLASENSLSWDNCLLSSGLTDILCRETLLKVGGEKAVRRLEKYAVPWHASD